MAWLPPEILMVIVSHIYDPSTLVSLQSVNKDWSVAAAWQQDRMFLLLDMNKRNQDIIEKRRKDLRARDLVRGIVVNHPDGDYWHDNLPGSGRMTVDVRFKHFERLSFFFRAKVGQFPNLDRLTLHLRPPRVYKPIPQVFVQKEAILQEAIEGLIKALKKLGKAKKGDSLNELSIQCLPTQVRFPGSPDWDMESHKRAITKLRLKNLKIGLVSSTVWNWTPADQPVGDPPWFWVMPTMRTLRKLSITCWGFYIKNIAGAGWGQSMFLPSLESLELRGCGFTADTQLDWIVRHGRTLTHLKLHDCAIVHRLIMWTSPQGVVRADQCHASLRIVNDGPRGKVRLYNTRWSQYFDKMQLQLPQLKHFEIGSSRVRAPGEEGPSFMSEEHHGPELNRPSQFLFGLFPDRYLKMADKAGCPCCSWVLGSCSWVLGRAEQEGPKRQKLLLDDSDREALRGLLQKIGQSVHEDANSDHAGYVRKLMGRVKADNSQSSKGSLSSEGTSSSADWDSDWSSDLNADCSENYNVWSD
ncbi:F-box domain protein [Penicillium subrubescens]|uniref:F-box domain protein n=1 Tax=Penicillium subrubescens TaxID=1316194 RepID=UPI002545731F|nr:F-box domain protein [Penicillium subrubescens]KAJ5901028.1 F-box domain protein [Penicillium subrubescens]